MIVATSALGAGFDYPHVRSVIHAGAPRRLSAFSQESGRAGRSGEEALSVVLLEMHSSIYKSYIYHDTAIEADHDAMSLYLTEKYCYRGILSQYFDTQVDWLWCMEGDVLCGVCDKEGGHVETRPVGLEYTQEEKVEEELGAAREEALRQDRDNQLKWDFYSYYLLVVAGSCLYCRMMGHPFDHEVGICKRRWDWINPKQKLVARCKRGNIKWMPTLIVCWNCYQPQKICRVADPEVIEVVKCEHPDIIIPTCYGIYRRNGGRQWLENKVERKFKDEDDYMMWIGGKTTFAGCETTQAVKIAVQAISEIMAVN